MRCTHHFHLVFALFAIATAGAAPRLFFADSDGDLRSAEFDGSNITALQSGLAAAFVEVDHQHVYFSEPAADRVRRMNLDGTGLTTIADAASHGIDTPYGLARIGADGLLIVHDGRIDHLDLGTGVLTVRVDSNLSDPRGIHLAGDVIAIADGGDNTVKQVNAAGGILNPVTTVASLGAAVPTDLTSTSTGQLFVTTDSGVAEITPPGTVTSVFGVGATGIAEADGVLYFNVKRDLYQKPLPSGAATVLLDDGDIPGLGILFGIDATPIPLIDVANAGATEQGGQMRFTVRLNELTSEPVTVDFATSDDTATAPQDYVATSGQVTILPGALSKKVFVSLVADNRYEDNERFRLTISNPSFGEITDALAFGTIRPVSPIDSTLKYSWGQNIGWNNWRPGVNGADALTFHTHLGGFIWNQNCGWLNLGDGEPANGHTYSNTSAGDCGINLLPGGELEGFAWGQNIGWVNFEQTRGKPQLDYKTGALSGYAWGQNVGWINLGTGTAHAVATTLLEYRDEDGDGIDDAWEIAYANGLNSLAASSDFDKDGVSDLDEFLADTDPFDIDSHLQWESYELGEPATPDNVYLEWTAGPARCYDLDASTDLVSFAPHTLGIPGGTPTADIEFTDPLPARKFWRITPRLPLTHD